MAAETLPTEVPRFFWNERDKPSATFRTLEVMLRDHHIRLIDIILNHAGLIDGAIQLVSAPASAGASGTAGQFAYDSDYIYVCIATDTWKRAAISTW